MLTVTRKIPTLVQVVCYRDKDTIECVFNLKPSVENVLRFMREYPDVNLIDAMKDEVFPTIRKMVIDKNPEYANRLTFTLAPLGEITVEDTL